MSDVNLVVRTSARVIKKLKLDVGRPQSPVNTKKDDTPDINNSKLSSQNQKSNALIWTNIERNLFFEALNEHGKDFESITHYINGKLKRGAKQDQAYKSKEHVRQLYYQTFHKLSKFLKFSDDVKKVAQELYTLINYGEMRKKLLFVTEKACMKLRELVYKGHVTIRFKGKNIKLKTPTCKALRKINQLKNWQEDIRLPSRVEVFITPGDVLTWGRVQNLALNPRIKTHVPLQKRVITLIKTLEQRWRSDTYKMHEKANEINFSCQKFQKKFADASNESYFMISSEEHLCLTPQPGTAIHHPVINLTEFLSSLNMCLNSYEERIGAKTKGEFLPIDRVKRTRCEVASDKSTVDLKKNKTDEENATNLSPKDDGEIKSNATADVASVNHSIEYPLLDTLKLKAPFATESVPRKSQVRTMKSFNLLTGKEQTVNSFQSLISETMVSKLKSGLTFMNVGDLTFGDLYLMIGKDSKINLEYKWNSTVIPYETLSPSKNSCDNEENVERNTDAKKIREKHNSKQAISNRLNQLLLIATLSEKAKKKTLPMSYEQRNKVFDEGNYNGGVDYLFPKPRMRPTVAASMRHMNIKYNKQPRWIKEQNNRSSFPTKQVLVQRLLLVESGAKDTSQHAPACVEYIKNRSVNSFKATEQNTNSFEETIKTSDSDSIDMLLENDDIFKEDNYKYNVTPPLSPSRMVSDILRESSEGKEWLQDSINDYSFSSLLGHLDNSYEKPAVVYHKETSNLSEISIDYMTKFAQIAAELKAEDNPNP